MMVIFEAAIICGSVVVIISMITTTWLYRRDNNKTTSSSDFENTVDSLSKEECYKRFYLTIDTYTLDPDTQDLVDKVYMQISYIHRRQQHITAEHTRAEFVKIRDRIFEETVSQIINATHATDKNARKTVSELGKESLSTIETTLESIKQSLNESVIQDVKKQKSFLANIFHKSE